MDGSALGVLGGLEVSHTPLECFERLVRQLDEAGEAAGVVGQVSLEGFVLTAAPRFVDVVRPELSGTFTPTEGGAHVSYAMRVQRGRFPYPWFVNAIWPIAWLLWLFAVGLWLAGLLPLWQVALLAVGNLVLGVLLRRSIAHASEAPNLGRFLRQALLDPDEMEATN